ncbi:MAG: TIGR02466 family protein [Pseudomonadota bacterium]
MAKIIGLFPTPFMKVDGFLDDGLREVLTGRAREFASQANSATDLLSHTQMLDPAGDVAYGQLAEQALPHIVKFGALLFAKELNWTVKEMWLNVLESGGSQFMHTHANSFVSGIVYINKPHESTHTVFRKSTGGGEFIMKNDVPTGHFSSDTWIVPEIAPGDLVLYPSHLLHGVPPNEGAQRITVAFNAIPDSLDSLGYKISFS